MTTTKTSTSTAIMILFVISTLIFTACSSPAELATDLPPTVLPLPKDTPATIPTEAEPVVQAAITQVPQSTLEPIMLVDGLDREVNLDKPAQRVVSLAPSNTEILFAIGAGEQVIGRDEFSDYPDQAASLPSVGGGFGDYNFEAIVDLKPDLVLAAEINTPEQVKSLEDLGLTVYFLQNPTTLNEMYQNLIIVAEHTGHSSEADELADNLRSRVSKIESLIETVKEKPITFYELDATDPSAPWTAGSGTFIDTLITMAGGENIISNMEGQYLQLSVEELLVQDPQVILLGDAAYGITPESIMERTGWNNISAVVTGKIYSFDDNLVSRPGPRLVDGLEELARLLHPELFED